MAEIYKVIAADTLCRYQYKTNKGAAYVLAMKNIDGLYLPSSWF